MYSQLCFIDKKTEVLAMENPVVCAPKGTLTCSNLGSESYIWPRCKWKSGQKNSLINCQDGLHLTLLLPPQMTDSRGPCCMGKGQGSLEEPKLLLCLTGWVGPRVRACLFLKGGGILLVLCFGVYLFFHCCWDKVPQTFDFKQKLEPGEVTQDSCLQDRLKAAGESLKISG